MVSEKIYKMKYCIMLITAMVLLTGCKKDEESSVPIDYIVFGHFYGECAGEQCIEIFKLDCCQLYEDTNDVYPDQGNQYIASYKKLEPAKYDSVKFLTNEIPAILFTFNQKVIGTPDAGDWGGIYFEIKYSDSTIKYWFIDQMKSNVPSSLHPFIDNINLAIAKLQ